MLCSEYNRNSILSPENSSRNSAVYNWKEPHFSDQKKELFDEPYQEPHVQVNSPCPKLYQFSYSNQHAQFGVVKVMDGIYVCD